MLASTYPPLLEVTARLGAQKINFVVETGDAILILPKKYLGGVVIYQMKISIVSANGQKIEYVKFGSVQSETRVQLDICGHRYLKSCL